MDYQYKHTLSPQTDECLVIGFFDNSLPELIDQYPAQKASLTRMSSKLTTCFNTAWQMDFAIEPGVDSSLLLIHCGKEAAFTTDKLKQCMAIVCAKLLEQKIASATIFIPRTAQESADFHLQQLLLAADYATYQLLDFKTIEKSPHALERITFCVEGASAKSLETARAIADGIQLTRRLADLPANRCTPTFLGQEALRLSQQYPRIKTHIIDKDALIQLGANAILTVGKGSEEPPALIELRYQGHPNNQAAPIVLVGKGITFDSGGISIKPASGMEEMKYDMAGAASVLGALQACAALALPINVVGLLAAAENLPSGSAVKPGDIITTLSGQTVEILNTDAEGRLVLADALTYAERYEPQMVIDIATLTGAMVIALGCVATGFMTPDDELAKTLLKASHDSADKCWRLPLDDAYQEALSSPLADMINAGFDRSAGSITAACFLSRFTKKFSWAHLDIAGTAWVSGKKRQATGRPVALLVELLRHASTTR